MCKGPTLHPNISSDFSRSVLAEILRHAPAAATPGNSIQVHTEAFDIEISLLHAPSRPPATPQEGGRRRLASLWHTKHAQCLQALGFDTME